MSEPVQFPITADEVEQLLRSFVVPADTPDVLEVKPTTTGTSFFLHGAKVASFSEMKKMGATWYLPNSLLLSIGAGNPDKAEEDFLPIRSLLPYEMEALIPALQELEKAYFMQQSAYIFGCCNSFLACSDARRCLHEKDREYIGCLYRKNLEAGRIFYGQNRNVQG